MALSCLEEEEENAPRAITAKQANREGCVTLARPSRGTAQNVLRTEKLCPFSATFCRTQTDQQRKANRMRSSDRGCAISEAGLSSLYVEARVAPVCDHSVAWGDSICGRRRQRDAALACSMIAFSLSLADEGP